MIVLVFEWDGIKPPTGFYRRLHRYGLHVGSRDTEGKVGAIQRRISSGNVDGESYNAVVFQEGTVMCNSERLAKNIYQKAIEEARRSGIDLACQWIEGYPVDIQMNAEDKRAYQQVEAVLGRKGRPAGQKQDWVVTCMECGITAEIKDTYVPICCDSCGSSNIDTRPGEFMRYKIPTGPLFDAWLSHRFASGSFEVPDVRDAVDEPPKVVNVTDKGLRDCVNEIMQSGIADALSKALPRAVAMSYLDAIFLARCSKSEKTRQEARTRAILELYQKGVQLDLFELESVSILDAACIQGIGPERAAGAYKTVYAKQ